MPLISTKLNVSLSPDKERIIKAKYGKAITVFPGKTEQWLMMEFRENCRLWFGGDNTSPAAMVEVKLLGTADHETCSEMTGKICEILSDELGILPDHIYVNYTFSTEWGWNGTNF